uniref:Uncharacterized protein n=1 Tax=Ascaris lumbricoides TaxID=6252 RepID=A0A9J2P9Q4_ASCLU
MMQYSQQCSQGVLRGGNWNIPYNAGSNSPSYSLSDPESQGRNVRNGWSVGFCGSGAPQVSPYNRPGFNNYASNFQQGIPPNYTFASVSQQNANNNFNYSPYTLNGSNHTPFNTGFSDENPYFTYSNLTQPRFSKHGNTCGNNVSKCCTAHQPSTTTFIQPTTAGTCILIRKTPPNSEVEKSRPPSAPGAKSAIDSAFLFYNDIRD